MQSIRRKKIDFEPLVKMITISFGALMVCNFSFNYAYFYAIKFPLDTLPITFDDFFKSIPLAALVLFTMTLAFIKNWYGTEHGFDEKSKETKKKWWHKTFFKRMTIGIVSFLGLIGAFIITVKYNSEYYQVFFMILIFMIVFFLMLYFEKNVIDENIKKSIIAVIFTVLIVAFYGYKIGHDDILSKDYKYVITFKSSSEKEDTRSNMRQVKILKSISSGVIFQEEKNHFISFTQWSNIDFITLGTLNEPQN